MPELPEVETVKERLKQDVLKETIKNVKVYYPKMIENVTSKEFINTLIGQSIVDIKRRGKWLIFELTNNYMLSHLRMEGRYYLKTPKDELEKHEYVCFTFESGKELRYKDTRKFGRMFLYPKDDIYTSKELKDLGLEPFSKDLTVSYLKEKYKRISLPIKTTLLNQDIIVGIGNIYADEILFLSGLNPLKKAKDLNDDELAKIIKYTAKVLKNAIKKGGTTIKTYEVAKNVHGGYQTELLVHTKANTECPICHSIIRKTKVNGRGTYYCPKCQK